MNASAAPRTIEHQGRPASAGSLPRFAYIDALRGIAILSVIVHHLPGQLGDAFGPVATMGGRGVDLFFVLSGFLIGSTALVRAEWGGSPFAQAGGYWILRTARIWPLYFLLLALYAVGPTGIDPTVTLVLRRFPGHFLTFTSNDFGQATLELGVLWSLAIEEQFYLTVGLLILAGSRRREVLGAAFVGMALTAIAVALRTRLELRSLLSAHGLDQTWFIFRTYHSTLARIDQLAIGMLCAVAAPAVNRLGVARSMRGAKLATWAGIAALACTLFFLPQFPVLEFLVMGVVAGAVVLWCQRPSARSSVSPWERLPLACLGQAGKLSFGLYMVHPIARFWVERAFAHAGLVTGPAPLFLVSWLAISWVLASLSYRFLELPILTRARRWSDKVAGKPHNAESAAVIVAHAAP